MNNNKPYGGVLIVFPDNAFVTLLFIRFVVILVYYLDYIILIQDR